MSCLVLDAMGVIFKSADDVAELLIPFISEKAGSTDSEAIQSAYIEASLGNIDPDEFWVQVKVSPELENNYLSQHSLNPGALELLAFAEENKVPVWCLSNDVGRWSNKLRSNLGVERYLAGSIISSDVGVRKPDSKIYEILVDYSGYKIDDLLFVDDREKNVLAASKVGIEAVLYKPEEGFSHAKNWISRRVP
jgi:FMN phosphatase YigB (HAD superfamily)